MNCLPAYFLRSMKWDTTLGLTLIIRLVAFLLNKICLKSRRKNPWLPIYAQTFTDDQVFLLAIVHWRLLVLHILLQQPHQFFKKLKISAEGLPACLTTVTRLEAKQSGTPVPQQSTHQWGVLWWVCALCTLCFLSSSVRLLFFFMQ